MEKRIQNRLTIIAGLLVLILGIFIVKENLSQFKSSSSLATLLHTSKNEINRIDIAYKNTQVTLEKSKSTWNVIKPKKGLANQERVDTTLTELLSLTKDNIISTNKSKQKSLGIGTDKITIYTPSKQQEIFIGTTEAGETNITFSGDNNTYAVSDISDIVNPIEYRDLHVPAITDLQQINGLDINYGGNDIHLNKKDTIWTANGLPAKTDRITSLLNDLKSLTAADIDPLTNKDKVPSLSMQIKEQGKIKTLTFFETDTNYHLIMTGSNDTYTINKIYGDSFKKTLSDLTE